MVILEQSLIFFPSYFSRALNPQTWLASTPRLTLCMFSEPLTSILCFSLTGSWGLALWLHMCLFPVVLCLEHNVLPFLLGKSLGMLQGPVQESASLGCFPQLLPAGKHCNINASALSLFTSESSSSPSLQLPQGCGLNPGHL